MRTIQPSNPTAARSMTQARLEQIEQLIAPEGAWMIGIQAMTELIAEVRRLQVALREACDWMDCESGEGIVEQRAAVIRLRAIAGE